MGNYKKDEWDDVDHEAGETEAAHIGIDQRLTDYPETDRLMDERQEKAYRILRLVVKYCPIPWVRDAVRQALALLAEAEELEAVNEENVAVSRDELEKAREHNHNVIGIAEENRGPKAHANGTSAKSVAV